MYGFKNERYEKVWHFLSYKLLYKNQILKEQKDFDILST